MYSPCEFVPAPARAGRARRRTPPSARPPRPRCTPWCAPREWSLRARRSRRAPPLRGAGSRASRPRPPRSPPPARGETRVFERGGARGERVLGRCSSPCVHARAYSRAVRACRPLGPAHLPRIEQSVELLVHARIEGVDLRVRRGLVHARLQRLECVDERQQTAHRLDPADLVLARELGARLLPEALKVRRQQKVSGLACRTTGRALATRRSHSAGGQPF